MPSQPTRISNGELADRIKSILARRNLTLYQVSERSAALFGQSSPHYLPHNLYYDLRHGSFTPSIFQLFALSRISSYRFTDWLRVFRFDVGAIPRLQIQLSSNRTVLLDSSMENPHTLVPWLRNLPAGAEPEDVLPLSQVMEWTRPRTLASLGRLRDKGFLYAKIGYQDSWSFPELLPGSIVRVRLTSIDDLLQRLRGEQSKSLILLENAKGFCCCRIRVVGAGRIAMVPSQMPYARVEFSVPQEARIIGTADLEIRNLLRPEQPAVPREFAKRWRPETLLAMPTQLGPLLRQARLRMGLSFREASAISREIANLLDDLRYFTAPSSLSDYESGNIPRHIHKVITFCVVYSLDLETILQSLGLSPQDAGQEPIPQVLTGRPLSAAAEEIAETDESEQTGFLGRLLGEFGEIPFFLRGSFHIMSGLRIPSLKDCFWIGGARESHPYLAGALLALVNRQKKKPNDCGSKPMWQQPLYVVLKRDGIYLCGCCSRENNSLVVHTYSSGVHRRDQFRHRDAEVIGKIVTVARKLS